MRANPKNYKVERLEGVNLGSHKKDILDMASQMVARFEFEKKEAFSGFFTMQILWGVCLALKIPRPVGGHFIIHWYDKK